VVSDSGSWSSQNGIPKLELGNERIGGFLRGTAFTTWFKLICMTAANYLGYFGLSEFKRPVGRDKNHVHDYF